MINTDGDRCKRMTIVKSRLEVQIKMERNEKRE